MKIETFVLTPFQQNTRLVVCPETNHAMCIDPGEPSPALADHIRLQGYELRAIALTHGHLDHVGGTAFLKRAFPEAEILLHADDEQLYYGLPRQPLMMGVPAAQLSALGMDYEDPPAVTRNWQHGEKFQLGKLTFEVLHCPGHTPGHVVLADRLNRAVFVGDCLFAGSIGRSDLPGGDHPTLMRSIRENILPLGDDVTVYSGHGPETTIGHERVTNPFLTGVYQLDRGRYI